MRADSPESMISTTRRWLGAAVFGLGILSGCVVTDSSSWQLESRQPVDADSAEISKAGPCAEEIAKGLVCEAANRQALELMQAGKLKAITVVQNASTGALVAFAAADPIKLDVSNSLPPLSVVKLMLAASR